MFAYDARVTVGNLQVATALYITAVSTMAVFKNFFSKFYNTAGAPPEIFNRTLYFAIFVFGILGCARGYDEGYIGGIVTKSSFKNQFGLNDPTKTATELANLKSNITSMVILGSIGGSLLAMYFVDKFGRIRTLQGVCVGWIVAVVIQITSKKLGQLYVACLKPITIILTSITQLSPPLPTSLEEFFRLHITNFVPWNSVRIGSELLSNASSSLLPQRERRKPPVELSKTADH
ncbi:uncharacterized protein CYBJADRAFT_189616 [Cyberlindnera jadinii NRRL Y-1542]|uniref:Major facilitator superfamily (MFS) profile domain-containing protein n=1 Tax=Cyberlindnera jadinii (strain ATCC 18201 / CBS 1600 / BCRC 20928 / JCM 3617 / NBRC 0987 / NRRL Y-1542) TaxID=983966 RepID=A0A1E4S4X6_CYBJN|nr:hypothetical protein CYBJADRAFT_189616 [Cyberlindnera jadinii NRRL Y-1542]ODV74551.1 hypothetical protein CYBJADRAFT_189616 [Cyberlindnera jadinii NRRL Y-1542]